VLTGGAAAVPPSSAIFSKQEFSAATAATGVAFTGVGGMEVVFGSETFGSEDKESCRSARSFLRERARSFLAASATFCSLKFMR
jgi:hypothetical protein